MAKTSKPLLSCEIAKDACLYRISQHLLLFAMSVKEINNVYILKVVWCGEFRITEPLRVEYIHSEGNRNIFLFQGNGKHTHTHIHTLKSCKASFKFAKFCQEIEFVIAHLLMSFYMLPFFNSNLCGNKNQYLNGSEVHWTMPFNLWLRFVP